MQYEIKNRFSLEVIFTAEIEADEKTSNSIKLGLAIKAAIKIKANLQEADLQWANLQEANLQWANLQEANLRGANLRGANIFLGWKIVKDE